MSKQGDRNIVQVSLSSFAHRRLQRLAELMDSKIATQAARPVEDWVASEEFNRILQAAEEERKAQRESAGK